MEFQTKVSFILCIILVVFYNLYQIRGTFKNVNPEDMIREENYPVETHTVLTEDGYYLTIHRIPGLPGSVPVYLQHGLVSNSADWIKSGKNRSLVYLLWDHGYDVWIGNARGNIFSKMHKTWSTSDSQFWNFSWHDQGIYDIPAVITYISDITNNTMFYIGHSMGVSTFSVMAIQKPEIAEKIRATIALAPAVYERHIQQPIIRGLANNIDKFMSYTKTFGIEELFSYNNFCKWLYKFCEIPLIGSPTCSNILFYMFGHSPDQLDYTKLKTFLQNVPGGTSVKVFSHWLQQMNVNEFRNYDYGPETNLKMYNNTEPPKYDLSKIKVPIAVFYSDNDVITTSKDVKHFYSQIPNKLGLYDVGHSFNHIDFLWGIDARELIFYKILDIFKSTKVLEQDRENEIN